MEYASFIFGVLALIYSRPVHDFWETIHDIFIQGGDKMDVSKIIDGINKKKEELNVSNQTISDASGVPKSTVDRILRKDTENPYAQNVLDIAAAVGYRIGGDIEKPPFPADEKLVEYIMQLNDDRITRMRAAHNQVLAEKDRTIETQRKYIRGLVIAVILLVVFLVGWLIIDILHPTAGWVQRELAAQNRSSFWGDMLHSFQNFFHGI